jgi:Flp pilus assembly protein TadB
MGTAAEWMGVIFMAVFWTACMLWVSRKTESGRGRELRVLRIGAFIAGSFFVGIVTAFGLRALRWPLVALLVPILVASAVLGARYRRKLRMLEAGH